MSGGEETQCPAGAEAASTATNCLSNGEQGREPTKVPANAADSLNFGWFSLPRNGNGSGASRQGSRPASVSGRKQQGSRPASQSGRGPPPPSGRPDSHSGRSQQQQAQPGWEVPPGEAISAHGGPADTEYVTPPDPQQVAHTAGACQRLVVSDDPEMADFERSGQEQPQSTHGDYTFGQGRGQGDDLTGQTAQTEIDAVDWPLSRAAQEMMMRQAQPPAEPGFSFGDKQGISSRPGSRGSASQAPPVPPTPMPPLTWGGYRDTSRPTFASWREQWHRAHSQPAPHSPAHGRYGGDMRQRSNESYRDLNNNNCYGNTNKEGISNSNSNDTNGNTNNSSGYKYCSVNNDSIFSCCDSQRSAWENGFSGDQTVSSRTEAVDYGSSVYRARKSFSVATLPEIDDNNDDNDYDDGQDDDTIGATDTENSAGSSSFSVFEWADKNTNAARSKEGTITVQQLSWQKSQIKRGATVDPFACPELSISNMGASFEELDFTQTNELEEEYGGTSARQKSSFAVKVRSRLQGLKEAAAWWTKKVRGRSTRHSNYCQFENDY